MIHCTNSDCSNSDLPVTLDRGVPYEPDIWNLNKDFIFFVINIMGDVGIFMQMIGFSIFLIIPIKETFNIQLEATKESRLSSFLERKSVRIFGILLILIGLSFQFDFLRGLAIQSFSYL
jgi:hypothetical protein